MHPRAPSPYCDPSPTLRSGGTPGAAPSVLDRGMWATHLARCVIAGKSRRLVDVAWHVVPLSVLDLAPIGTGSTATAALATSTKLVQLVEDLGFRRYWVAEHHGMPGIASSSPAVLIAHLAAVTERIRVGSGGVMLPNHQPLVIAEQFGTLDALHPGRIDLGIGRAPGTDQRTARALRRGTAAPGAGAVPHQPAARRSYFPGGRPPPAPPPGGQGPPGGRLGARRPTAPAP